MAAKKHLIIGCSSAALSALEKIRAIAAEDEIKLVTKEEYSPYSPTSLPYLLSGRITEKELPLREENYLETLSRKKIAKKSIDERGAAIITKDMAEAIELMNQIAPEHLELLTENPFELIPKIKHAGAIFVGENTPEPIGDYVAGPNHTLPTGGTARFFSPLGVENFLKRTSVISFSKEAIEELGEKTAKFADTEGLTAHSQSIRERVE